VIASGGAGKPEISLKCWHDADAALAASIFHYGTYTVGDLKSYPHAHGESGCGCDYFLASI